MKRRTMLGLGLGGITAAVAPTLWLPRHTHAATPAFGAVRHLLIVYLNGGARSQCLFNANVGQQWNPAQLGGVQAGAPGTDWGVGGVFQTEAYSGGLGGAPFPSMPEISDRVCVLGTVDHTPGEPYGDADHQTAQLRMATGAPDGKRGLLPIIYRDGPMYAGGNPDRVLPPVVVGSGGYLFGTATGALGAYRAIQIGHHSELLGAGSDGSLVDERPWARELSSALDTRYAASRAARHRGQVHGLIDAKRQVADFSGVLNDPALDIVGRPDAEMGGITNGELDSIFLDPDYPDDIARHAALAIRMLQNGSAAVVIGDASWDFHSDELTMFATKGVPFGRVWAGLHHVLSNLAHPDGGTFWEHTLVVACSEFSRDNTDGTGFNSGNGSDHVGTQAMRYQAIPCMGSVVGQGGRLLGATDPLTMEPLAGEPVFSSISLLATCLDVLGVDASDHFPDAPLEAIL